MLLKKTYASHKVKEICHFFKGWVIKTSTIQICKKFMSGWKRWALVLH
jgi:hypothetical protein